MAHEMYEHDTALTVKGESWHGLGINVEHAVTHDQAYHLSGLDWDVVMTDNVKADVSMGMGWRDTVTSDKWSMTLRMPRSQDNHDPIPLGMVSNQYTVIQNKDLFDAARIGLGYDVETAGSLKNGQVVYLLLKTGSFDATGKGDEIAQYFCLVNGHNGLQAYSAMPTSVRVVCNNTLSMAIGEAKSKRSMFSLRHKGDYDGMIKDMQDALHNYRVYQNLHRNTVTELGAKAVTRDKIQEFWLDVYQQLTNAPLVVNPTNKNEMRAKADATLAIANWTQTFDRDLEVSGPTAWNAANAVTEWIQKRVPSRGRKLSEEGRRASNLLGANMERSRKVMNLALSM